MVRDDDDESEDQFWKGMKAFLSEHKEDIGTVIRAFGENVKQGPKMKFRGMVAVFILLGVIITTIAYLSTLHIVSGDAVAFLIGSIVGYLFSFLRHYVVGVAA